MIINLDSPKEVTIQNPIKITVSSFNLISFTDNKDERIVNGIIQLDGQPDNINIVIWYGDDYDNSGQYTDEDIINRIKKIL